VFEDSPQLATPTMTTARLANLADNFVQIQTKSQLFCALHAIDQWIRRKKDVNVLAKKWTKVASNHGVDQRQRSRR
jgi:hypothetical protein